MLRRAGEGRVTRKNTPTPAQPGALAPPKAGGGAGGRRRIRAGIVRSIGDVVGSQAIIRKIKELLHEFLYSKLLQVFLKLKAVYLQRDFQFERLHSWWF